MPKEVNLDWAVPEVYGQEIIFTLRLRDIEVKNSCGKDIVFIGSSGR